MYNDQAVLEDGIWRLWSVAIDEHYFQSAGYDGGWNKRVRITAERPSAAT
jgi:hypothetical protein